jgi:chemotaxis response regulator CheB
LWSKSAAERRGLTRVVGVGASAGGLGALPRLVRTLPAEPPLAHCIVLHVPATDRAEQSAEAAE